ETSKIGRASTGRLTPVPLPYELRAIIGKAKLPRIETLDEFDLTAYGPSLPTCLSHYVWPSGSPADGRSSIAGFIQLVHRCVEFDVELRKAPVPQARHTPALPAIDGVTAEVGGRSTWGKE